MHWLLKHFGQFDAVLSCRPQISNLLSAIQLNITKNAPSKNFPKNCKFILDIVVIVLVMIKVCSSIMRLVTREFGPKVWICS